MRTTVHNSAQLRCFENGNDDFGVEAFWIGDAARVGYFVPFNGPLNGHPPSLQLLQAVDIFTLSCFNFFLYKCENRRIPYYFKNMFLTHDNSRRLKKIRCAQQRCTKMETNLPNNSNYEINVKHTYSKYGRVCIRHEIPKLIKDNYLPGKVLEK